MGLNLISFCGVEKPGAQIGSTQRGCCRNLGESSEDDEFEAGARRQRLAGSSKKRKNRNLNGENEEEEKEKSGRGNEEGGDKTVSEQPAASPEMTAPPTDDVTKT